MKDPNYKACERPATNAPFVVLMLTASVGNRTKEEQRKSISEGVDLPLGRFANFVIAVRPEVWSEAMDWLLAEGGVSDMYEIIEFKTPHGPTEGYKETALRFEEKPGVGQAPTFEADHAAYALWRDNAAELLGRAMSARGFCFESESVCQAMIDPKTEFTGAAPTHDAREAMMEKFGNYYCFALDQAALRATVREAEADNPATQGSGSAARRAPRML